MNQEWIKNLANSELVNGKWVPKDKSKIQREISTQMNDTISDLIVKMEQAAEVYNSHAPGGNKIKIFPVNAPERVEPFGALMLLGRIQLKVSRVDSLIKVTLVKLQGYERQNKILHQFTPVFDAFGTLVWKNESGVLMDLDIMVKVLFEDLVRIAYHAQ